VRRLYNWTMQFASGPNALWALIVVSFAESSFFPIPPDVLLVPMVLANREKAFKFIAACTLASVAGGMFGYWIGASLYDTVGQWIIHLYGLESKVETLRQGYQENGGWFIVAKGFLPIPYKLVTIASGFFGYNFWMFMLLSLLTRGARFGLVGLLLAYYGEPVRTFIEKRLELVAATTAVIIIAGFVAIKYII
jgi:membrane protein YqaA with SNARE-associated domain